MAHLEITPAMQAALDAIAQTEATYVPGRESSAVIELPKLALAEATMAAVQAAKAHRVDRLPTRGAAVAASLRHRPARRRRA